MDMYAAEFPDMETISTTTRKKLSTNTTEHFVRKYGTNGAQRYLDHRHFLAYKNSSEFNQQTLGWTRTQFDKYNQNRACTNKQFSKWVHALGRLCVYDLVVPDLMLCVEFNGDYWHCNPSKFDSEYVHPHRKKSAKDIWEHDAKKIEYMTQLGYTVFVGWEHDWITNPEHEMRKIGEYVEHYIRHYNTD